VGGRVIDSALTEPLGGIHLAEHVTRDKRQFNLYSSIGPLTSAAIDREVLLIILGLKVTRNCLLDKLPPFEYQRFGHRRLDLRFSSGKNSIMLRAQVRISSPGRFLIYRTHFRCDLRGALACVVHPTADTLLPIRNGGADDDLTIGRWLDRSHLRY